MADRDIEASEGKGADFARRMRLHRSIWREWQAAGYFRNQHMLGLKADGDVGALLAVWRRNEADCRMTPRPFATWLAAQDMWQIESELALRVARR